MAWAKTESYESKILPVGGLIYMWDGDYFRNYKFSFIVLGGGILQVLLLDKLRFSRRVAPIKIQRLGGLVLLIDNHEFFVS
jgi:hypothetical protein